MLVPFLLSFWALSSSTTRCVPNQNVPAKFLIREAIAVRNPFSPGGWASLNLSQNGTACAALRSRFDSYSKTYGPIPVLGLDSHLGIDPTASRSLIPGLPYNSLMRTANPFFRPGGRAPAQLRPLSLLPGFVQTAEGSVLVSFGNTRVLTNATIEPGVPGWLRNTGRGWVTAEYAMLPRSTVTRTPRESERGKIGGRTHEIQRLIGRSLRSVVDMNVLGERTVILDCDVIQADGGTRTAAITGAAVALALALNALVAAGTLKASPLKQLVAATSVGIVGGTELLDLCYEEDSAAEVDMNVVMTEDGGLIETQATAEKGSFSRLQLNSLLDLADLGLKEIFAAQRAVLVR